jgi:hypothetical protein
MSGVEFMGNSLPEGASLPGLQFTLSMWTRFSPGWGKLGLVPDPDPARVRRAAATPRRTVAGGADLTLLRCVGRAT